MRLRKGKLWIAIVRPAGKFTPTIVVMWDRQFLFRVEARPRRYTTRSVARAVRAFEEDRCGRLGASPSADRG